MDKNKRFRAESIKDVSSPFIVDNYSAKKRNAKHTTYKAYDTATMKKCEELTSLLNDYDYSKEQITKEYLELKDNYDTLQDKWLKSETERIGFKDDNVILELELDHYKTEREYYKKLAIKNEDSLLEVMTYLHDKYYDLWEEINKECFK